MGYPETTIYTEPKRKTSAPDTAVNLAAAAAQWAGFAVTSPMQVIRVKFFVTTQVTAGTTAPVIEIKRRPTYASSSGAVSIATMTIPNGATVGSVYYREVPYGSGTSNKYLNYGEELSFELKTQAADGGTAAGAGWIDVDFEIAIDQVANQTNAILGLA